MKGKKLTYAIVSFLGLLLLLFLAGVFLFSGDNVVLFRSIFFEEHTGDELRDQLSELGARGYISIIILSMLQVVVTILPAEPVQVLAGITFGFPIGLACCIVGVFLGSTLLYALYRHFGDKMRRFFSKNLDLDLDRIAESKHLVALIFILYFLPAIPYGMICFLAANLGMKYPRYIYVTLLGAIPSVCIGVGLGHMAITASWILTLVVFCLIVILFVLFSFNKDAVFRKINAFLTAPAYSSKTTVHKCSPARLWLPYAIFRIVFFFRGVRVRYVNKLGREVDAPSIVLCNHGSFVDFVHAGALIRRKGPNFIVARLYFYHKWLGRLLRYVGCFPKSMFATDLESAKNCLRTLKNGSVLAMMPEARLSTIGSFEDIQPGTFDFVKKAGVPVYTIKISGDYFADPKWGNGMRRGSLVEAELDLLLTAEELKALTVEEIRERVETRLFYDEFAWIKTKPKLRYTSKTLAEGLENILTRCPKCGGKYTIRTKKRDVFCEHCGKLATMDDRYAFDENAPFENFAAWYRWQSEQIEAEIEADPSYTMVSEVEFCVPSTNGKGMLRTAGHGVCTLDQSGLTYRGQMDGEDVELTYSLNRIYRLLFGAGENFEVYDGSEIRYFRPTERRSAVDWYIASKILWDRAHMTQKASNQFQ